MAESEIGGSDLSVRSRRPPRTIDRSTVVEIDKGPLTRPHRGIFHTPACLVAGEVRASRGSPWSWRPIRVVAIVGAGSFEPAPTIRVPRWWQGLRAAQPRLDDPQALVAVNGNDTALEPRVIAPGAQAEPGVVLRRGEGEGTDPPEGAVGDGGGGGQPPPPT